MYLDPSFGSMIIQVLIAALAAGGACLAIFRQKIAKLFKRGKQNGETPAAQDVQNETVPANPDSQDGAPTQGSDA